MNQNKNTFDKYVLMKMIVCLSKCNLCNWEKILDKVDYLIDWNHAKEKHPKVFFTDVVKIIQVNLAYDHVKGEFIKDIRIRHPIFEWHYERYGWGYGDDEKVISSAYLQYKKEVKEKKWIYK